MKKLLALLLAAALAFTLAGCGKKQAAPDESPITVNVSIVGGMQSYFLEIQKAVKKNLNIDLEFVFFYSNDTSNTLSNMFKYGDVSADMVITAAMVNNDYLRDTCLDYLTYTNITDNFTYSKVTEYTAEGGSVYQLPFTSKLIGVTYNKTLLAELGCEVPSNYEEMLALKQKCDENGILFAVSGGFAAGHGFNWLFHLMGADWLSTLDGTEWFNSYLAGQTTVDAFADEAKYFEKYFESGLFGEFYTADWGSSSYYLRQRALFNYDLTNTLSRAIRLNPDGTIYGAGYTAEGEVIAKEDNSGSFICLNGGWTVYDSANINHQGQQRYSIPGARIDEFGVMPWLSENGTNNRFTCYDNIFVMLNKNLADADKSDKLAKVLKVLEFMCTKDATEHFAATNRDGYVAVNDFSITSDRLYYAYASEVAAGYIQPWYYIKVDNDTLVNTGYAVNAYMAGQTDFNSVIAELDANVQRNANHISNAMTEVSEAFTYAQTADMLARAGAEALQAQLDEAAPGMEITVSLVPYTEKVNDMAPWCNGVLGICSTRLYGGPFYESYINTLIPSNAQSPVAIEMTGAELNAIIAAGLDRSEGGTVYPAKYGPYPYAVAVKNNQTIDDNAVYLVAVNIKSLSASDYNYFLSNNRVVTGADGKPVTANIKTALLSYLRSVSPVIPGGYEW